MARHDAELHNPGARLAGLLMLPRAADVARFLTAKEGHKFNLQGLQFRVQLKAVSVQVQRGASRCAP